MTPDDVAALDRKDPLRARRKLFELPPGVIYLDGNSLGPLVKSVRKRAREVIEQEWAGSLITAWNRHGWMDLPARVGDKIGKLIGAPDGTVIACDTTSVNIFKVLAAALALRPDRRVIVTDTNNFPSDIYVAGGVAGMKGAGCSVRAVPVDNLAAALDPAVAAVILTDVDYRTGRRHDMTAISALVQKSGALAIWDLCHSAGAMPTDLTAAKADLAVGCTYKYLNGGPGSPAFIYVAPKHHATVTQPLTGWLGHATPFKFEQTYRPAEGITRMITGTPSVIALSILEEALKAFDGLDMGGLHEKSLGLQDVFHAAVSARHPDLKRLTPLAPAARGSQLAYAHPHGYAIVQALIAKGVVGDFREPDVLRFGFAPLYLSYAEAARAGELLAETIAGEPWLREEFTKRKSVT